MKSQTSNLMNIHLLNILYKRGRGITKLVLCVVYDLLVPFDLFRTKIDDQSSCTLLNQYNTHPIERSRL